MMNPPPMMMMHQHYPPDEELQHRVLARLSSSDLSVLTFKALIKSLEEDFNTDLGHRKEFIRATFNSFIDAITAKEVYEVPSIVINDQQTGEIPNYQEPRRYNGFTAPMQLSFELGQFLGKDVLPRTEVMKYVWDYIKYNSLQNPQDKREINCDERLQILFKRKKINMFKMTKALSQMMKPYNELQAYSMNPTDAHMLEHQYKIQMNHQKNKLMNVYGESQFSQYTMGIPMQKRQKTDPMTSALLMPHTSNMVPFVGGPGGIPILPMSLPTPIIPLEKPKKKVNNNTINNVLHKKYKLSDALAEFINTKEESRGQVTSKVWVYIREHNLQNPNNKRQILCDEKLKALLGVDEVNLGSLTKYLSPHFLKDQPTTANTTIAPLPSDTNITTSSSSSSSSSADNIIGNTEVMQQPAVSEE